MTTVSNFHLTSVIISFLPPGSASLFVPGTRSPLSPVAGRGVSPSFMIWKDRIQFVRCRSSHSRAHFRQTAIARTFRSIGTGAAPSTGRFSEMAGNTMPPCGEPPVEGAGENFCAREAEQGGGPPPSPQPEKDLGRGQLAGEHLPVRQGQVHRRKACALPDVRKTEGKVLRVAGEKLEIFRAGPCPYPFDRASADGALAVVDEHGFLRSF